MKDASVESARFEPTVFGAVRRYRIMVLAITLLAVVAAIGYTMHKGKTYEGKASVTVAHVSGLARPRQPGAALGVASRRPASSQHCQRHIA